MNNRSEDVRLHLDDGAYQYEPDIDDDEAIEEYIEERRREFYGEWFKYMEKFYN